MCSQWKPADLDAWNQWIETKLKISYEVVYSPKIQDGPKAKVSKTFLEAESHILLLKKPNPPIIFIFFLILCLFYIRLG